MDECRWTPLNAQEIVRHWCSGQLAFDDEGTTSTPDPTCHPCFHHRLARPLLNDRPVLSFITICMFFVHFPCVLMITLMYFSGRLTINTDALAARRKEAL